MKRVSPTTWGRSLAGFQCSRGMGLCLVLAPLLLTFACSGEGHYGLELDDAGDDSDVDSDGGPVMLQDAEVCDDRRDASDDDWCSKIAVQGGFNECAQVGSYILSPLSATVGSEVEFVAVADDKENDPVVYLWTAVKGTFSEPHLPQTKYRCDEAGQQLIKLTVSDNPDCVSSVEIPVTCSAP